MHAGSVPPMFLSPDDAKTDVIFVGAAFVFGRAVQRVVSGVPGYPTTPIPSAFLDILWLAASTILIAVLLARHRGDGAGAFGLTGSRAMAGAGLVIALPAIAAEFVHGLGGPIETIALGRIGAGLLPAGGPDPIVLILLVGQLIALSAGTLLAISFLAVRARDGFPRSPDVPLTQLVRTVGLVAVGAATVLGLLNAARLRSGGAIVELGLYVVALALILMLVDRRVPSGLVVPRATILAPVVVVVLAHVMATGGLFFGDLLGGLLGASLALGVTVAVAALSQTSARTWAALPLVVAVHWWSASPLSPIA